MTSGAPDPVAPAGFAARLVSIWEDHLLRPVRAVRRAYVPLLMVYFA